MPNRLVHEDGTPFTTEEKVARRRGQIKEYGARYREKGSARRLESVLSKAEPEQGQTYPEEVNPIVGYKKKGESREPVLSTFPSKENKKF